MNKTITKEEIEQLPITGFGGKINVPLTGNEIRNAIDYLRKYPVLGFDTETRPNFCNCRQATRLSFSDSTRYACPK